MWTDVPNIRALWVSALAIGQMGCSPLVRVDVAIALPPGVTADPARMHVTHAARCDSFDLSVPPAVAPTAPLLGATDAGAPSPGTLTVAGTAITYAFEERAARCLVQVTGWLDANGNGRVDTGDAHGSFPQPMEVADRGLIQGNLNHLTLTLHKVP